MKYLKFFLFLNILFLTHCANNSVDKASLKDNTSSSDGLNYRNITVDELDSAFGDDPYIIIDVRTPEEVSDGMIEDALHIDFATNDFIDKLNTQDKKANYVIYCRSGGRSGKTLEKMKKLGFENVCNLEGGYLTYVASR